MWTTLVDYGDNDAPTTVAVLDIPWGWVGLTMLAAHVCRYRFLGRPGFHLLQWADRRGERVAREVFRIPLTHESAQRVAKALQAP